jgi:glutathione S-transferase
MDSMPGLAPFALTLIALFAKTTLTSMIQVVSRLRSGQFTVPEDAALMGRKPAQAEAALPQRCANVWRNDVENLPLFLALALAYVLLGASRESAQLLFGLYVGARYAHTVAYLVGKQPWRAMFYLAGLVVCWVIAIRIIGLVGLA